MWSCLSTHWSRALVFRDGSSGLKFLYSSTSFSMERSWLCSLALRAGRVSRMWLVSCCSGQRSELVNGNIRTVGNRCCELQTLVTNSLTLSWSFTHLIEDFLEVGSAHAVCQVSIRRVREKELPLSSYSSINVFLPIYVLLAPIHHTNVTWMQHTNIYSTTESETLWNLQKTRSNSFYRFLEFLRTEWNRFKIVALMVILGLCWAPIFYMWNEFKQPNSERKVTQGPNRLKLCFIMCSCVKPHFKRHKNVVKQEGRIT